MDILKIMTIANNADDRGDKYFIPSEAIDFIGEICEMHYVSMNPGAVRGDHYHVGAKELVIASYSDDWRCAWCENEDGKLHIEKMNGSGTVAVLIPSGIPHTFVNTGVKPIFLYCFSDRRYNPDNPHTFRKELAA